MPAVLQLHFLSLDEGGGHFLHAVALVDLDVHVARRDARDACGVGFLLRVLEERTCFVAGDDSAVEHRAIGHPENLPVRDRPDQAAERRHQTRCHKCSHRGRDNKPQAAKEENSGAVVGLIRSVLRPALAEVQHQVFDDPIALPGLERVDGSALLPAADDQVAIDGKELLSSQGQQIVSAYTVKGGRWLGSEAIASKSNEIPAAQALLRRAPIEGMVVTADALRALSGNPRFTRARIPAKPAASRNHEPTQKAIPCRLRLRGGPSWRVGLAAYPDTVDELFPGPELNRSFGPRTRSEKRCHTRLPWPRNCTASPCRHLGVQSLDRPSTVCYRRIAVKEPPQIGDAGAK